MLSKTVDVAPKHKFRFNNPLYSLDASTIELCLSLYNWAKFRTTKGAVKLHVKLNHDGYLPSFVVLTEGKVHEQRVAPRIPFEAGDVVVFDRGYSDFGWLASLCARDIYFVTRMKKNIRYRIVERRKLKSKEIIKCDQIIEVTGVNTQKKYPFRLRRIRAKDPETGKQIVLITNQMDWSPRTIAAVYKERWQIEIFFKTLKQVLKVKSFVGTSRNALLSQIWIALIAYLMLSYLKYVSRFAWSLYTLMSILPRISSQLAISWIG
jgi:putative transposase